MMQTLKVMAYKKPSRTFWRDELESYLETSCCYYIAQNRLTMFLSSFTRTRHHSVREDLTLKNHEVISVALLGVFTR